MRLERLNFYVNPLKVFQFLNSDHRKGKIGLINDATNSGFSVIGYGEKIISRRMADLDFRSVKDVFTEVEREVSSVNLSEFSGYEEGRKFNLPFSYGALGFVAYEVGNLLNNIESIDFGNKMPAMHFIITDEALIFDHKNRTMWLFLKDDTNVGLVNFYKSLSTKHFKDDAFEASVSGDLKMRISGEEYKEKFEVIKKKIFDGETYQVNFSQGFEIESNLSPWEFYKKITEINPSPCQVYFEIRDEDKFYYVVSNSPETLYEVENDNDKWMIKSKPIKGTVSLSDCANEEEVKLKIASLVDSVKDRAEIEMIVDMARNDLGKICKFGTVFVDRHREIKRYSHLAHTVSTVIGELKNGVSFFDIFYALFPGASITGCPKKRTMEIIRDIEFGERGVYCGAAGFLDVGGGSQFNIMIRTLKASNLKNGNYNYEFRAGGGIVNDSNVESEYLESINKTDAIMQIFKKLK